MKTLILLLTVFCTCLGVKAQESTTDYIYSEDGFEVKKVITYFTDQGEKYKHISKGLYSKDGKIFVAAMDKGIYEFYILDGCETICSGAFQALSDATVYIPSSIKYIAPDAINSPYKTPVNRFGGIKDGCTEECVSDAVNSPTADQNATEVARYNIRGIRLSEPANGVNIIHMSDGSAEKVLVK